MIAHGYRNERQMGVKRSTDLEGGHGTSNALDFWSQPGRLDCRMESPDFRWSKRQRGAAVKVEEY